MITPTDGSTEMFPESDFAGGVLGKRPKALQNRYNVKNRKADDSVLVQSVKPQEGDANDSTVGESNDSGKQAGR
jgi:hypothetical protein